MTKRRRELFAVGAVAPLLTIGGYFGVAAGARSSSSAPTAPPVTWCETPPSSPYTSAPAHAVTVPTGDDSKIIGENWLVKPKTTYWFAPGTHTLGSGQFGQIQPRHGDTFIGAPDAVLSGQSINQSAFDGRASNVTVKYLKIEDFDTPNGQVVINHDGGDYWTVQDNVVENNGGGAVGLGSNSVTSDNCLTKNLEYGFSATGEDKNVILTNNEISENSPWGNDGGCGCAGGGKFWRTINATVTGNYVHDNGFAGIWVDTDNAGFDIAHNYISGNFAEGIIYEASYNASIRDNTLVKNANGAGPSLGGFPDSAIYISESGGSSHVHSHYSGELLVSGNVLTDNWGGVVLWENANRYCGDGSDGVCTLTPPRGTPLAAWVNNTSACRGHLGETSPTDYHDLCRWKTRNVMVAHNRFDDSTSNVSRNRGENGLFSDYSSTAAYPGATICNAISNKQNNHFADNTYSGPWNFTYFNQGQVTNGTKWRKGIPDVEGSGDNFGPQDKGSTGL